MWMSRMRPRMACSPPATAAEAPAPAKAAATCRPPATAEAPAKAAVACTSPAAAGPAANVPTAAVGEPAAVASEEGSAWGASPSGPGRLWHFSPPCCWSSWLCPLRSEMAPRSAARFARAPEAALVALVSAGSGSIDLCSTSSWAPEAALVTLVIAGSGSRGTPAKAGPEGATEGSLGTASGSGATQPTLPAGDDSAVRDKPDMAGPNGTITLLVGDSGS